MKLTSKALRKLYDRLEALQQFLQDRAGRNTSLQLHPRLPFYTVQLIRMQDYCLQLEAAWQADGTFSPEQLHTISKDTESMAQSLEQFLEPWQ